MPELAVSVEGVSKTFGEHQALDAIDLSIPTGALYGVVGPNGAGKSTTLRMILDIIRPDRGTITVFGQRSDQIAKGEIGYLPEERGLYRKMKVTEVVAYFGQLRGQKRQASRHHAKELLAKAGLKEWMKHRVEDLSKGMQQRVQMACALVGAPRLVILDEPFSGLDPVNQESTKSWIRELRDNGTTVVLSTHQLEIAERMCERVALIHKGKAVLDDSIATIKARFGQSHLQVEFDGDASKLNDVSGIEIIRLEKSLVDARIRERANIHEVISELNRLVVLRRFEVMQPSLHDIFLQLVGDKRSED